MTALVSYASSDDGDGDHSDNEQVQEVIRTSPAKKRKISSGEAQHTKRRPSRNLLSSFTTLKTSSPDQTSSNSKEAEKTIPSLPAHFLDLYSSTVRTSTYDDPSLHAGRKRVTPHIAGSWAGHVFIDWYPGLQDRRSLAHLITNVQELVGVKTVVHSSLQNELNVPLPLHVSLSRPLNLAAESKDGFVSSIRAAVASSGVTRFTVSPVALKWHPNENQSRWFLVLQLDDGFDSGLERLLFICNQVARRFHQMELYNDADLPINQRPGMFPDETAGLSDAVVREVSSKKFHISIAWSLDVPIMDGFAGEVKQSGAPCSSSTWEHLQIPIDSVKIRIGQDVETVPLPTSRVQKILFA
nr:u6 snrna phosphodiesterase [Quercus suber]